MKTLNGLVVGLLLFGVSCDQDPSMRQVEPALEGSILKIAIPLSPTAQQDIARVEYLVEAADMNTLRGAAEVGDDGVIRGKVDGVPPGNETKIC